MGWWRPDRVLKRRFQGAQPLAAAWVWTATLGSGCYSVRWSSFSWTLGASRCCTRSGALARPWE